jgi:hypothetical protein
MGVLMRRVLTGHEKLAEWTPDDAASVDEARRLLRRELDSGYVAVRSDGDDNQPVTDLPPDAETVILTMPMGGGSA